MITTCRSNSGSVLITSLIFGFALFAAVSGYVYLSTHSMKMANRTFHLNSAMNLAEAGMEEGLHALNKFKLTSAATKDYTAFDNWTTNIDGDGDGFALDAKRTFSGSTYFNSNQGTIGEFTVIVTSWELIEVSGTEPEPTIIVRARSSIANQGVIEKVVRANTKRRSLFAGGLVSRRDIRFVGNFASVDSYNGNFGPYEYDTGTIGAKEAAEDVSGPASFNPDGIVNRFGNAIVASADIGVDLGNADVWGKVWTSGPAPDLGPNGTIADLGSAQGTEDPNRISTDFQAQFPVYDPPGDGTMPLTSLPSPDASGVIEVGNAGSNIPVIYRLTSTTLTGGERLHVVGPVRIYWTGNFRATAGTAGIDIDPMPQLFTNAVMTKLSDPIVPPLQVWVGGDFKVGVGGISSDYTTAASLQIYGTAPEPAGTTGTQSVEIQGAGGKLSASVYAPNADLTINGGDDVFGAFVANSIDVMGNAKFHYDESLAEKGTGKFGLRNWRELLTPAGRSAYAW
jgi:hypothetical protein